MGNGICRATLLALAAALLGGCGGSAEDRINSAVPVSKEVEASKAAFDLAAEAMSADTKALEADYQSQLRIRAIECGRGYVPSTFASVETIKREVGNAECFAAADTRLQRWIGLRRAGWLAAMPPLRPVPTTPPAMLLGTDRIIATNFAEAAGVAILQTSNRYQVVDLNNGTTIRVGDLVSREMPSLSPNGRLLVSSVGGEARIHDTETGELLGSHPDARGGRVFWMGDKGLVYAKPASGALGFLDLATGTETMVPMTTSLLTSVIPVPDKPGLFMLLGMQRAATLQLTREGNGWTPKLLQEVKTKTSYDWDGTAGGVVGNHHFHAAGGTLNQIQLDNLRIVETSFEPMHLTRMVPTRNPDQLIVHGRVGRSYGDEGMYLYSISRKTLAKIDTEKLLSRRVSYIPALRSNASIDGSKVVIVDAFSAAPPVALASVLNSMAFEAANAKLEMFERQQIAATYAGTGPAPAPAPPAISPASPSFAAGEAGLTEALRAGVLRLGNISDVSSWKRIHEGKTGKSLGPSFDERMNSQKVYVIRRDMVIPSGLNGAHSVVFVLDRGVPFPRGNAGHSVILDMGSGGCSGVVCRMYMQ